jgi:hypothetical protein
MPDYLALCSANQGVDGEAIAEALGAAFSGLGDASVALWWTTGDYDLALRVEGVDEPELLGALQDVPLTATIMLANASAGLNQSFKTAGGKLKGGEAVGG